MLALLCVPALASPTEAAAAQRRLPQVFTGQAFDTCSAPALSLLRAWRQRSPYGALGIYIGGSNRGCAQPRLNRAYVQAANAMGWRLLPLYVGAQAPCVTGAHGKGHRIGYWSALGQGQAEGADAVRQAQALGLADTSPIYLDMEAYARDRGRCSLAVLRYTTAWSRTVHSGGYVSGFYSSADSGVADLASLSAYRDVPLTRAAEQIGGLPDVIWYARWDHRSSTDGYRALGQSQWTGHRRVHQYVGNRTESHGGVRANIDRNAVDAPVALVE
ncbi:DUF1906 domain-containing protein [Streptacidiphilus rugosus]|uniref:DUF1906 domain-containing protein n=1 Tax=Streptacidiphilus rugosus TaxID=405783 RepID=UPI0007C768D8|nr:DUF1906 domain-containing protein [Streptacidiphilus rugosus]